MEKTAAGLLASAIGVAAPVLWKLYSDARTERRRNELKLVSEQIQYLYGPLFSLGATSRQAWILLSKQLRPDGRAIFAAEGPALSEAELKEWRRWMTTVFMPVNLQLEDAIVKHAHLIEGREMPACFLRLLAHVESYRVTLRRWEEQDFSTHTAALPYPDDFDIYVEQTYLELSRRQSELQKKIF